MEYVDTIFTEEVCCLWVMMFMMFKMMFAGGKEVEGKLPDGTGMQPLKIQDVQALDGHMSAATVLQQQTILETIESERLL
jgi:hypothetical protein